MTAPVPAGPTDAHAELREELFQAVVDRTPDEYTEDFVTRLLALDAVRAALAAQETVERVEAVLRVWSASGVNTHGWLLGDLRRALDGDR